MTISTITILFNGQNWIRRVLDNLLEQERLPDEMIVVDDGSTDASPELVREYSGVRLLRNPGKGASASRRFGLEQARHPLVALVDQDDLLHPAHLEKLAATIEAVPEAPGAVADLDLIERGQEPNFAPWAPCTVPLDPWEVFPLNPIHTPSQVLFRREVLLDQGGWDARFPGADDLHAWLTLTARQPFLPGTGRTVAHRVYAMSGRNLLKRRNRWDFCNRYLSAAQDRIPLRQKHHPLDANRVRARLSLARHVFAWRFADSMLGPRQAAPLALQADRLLATEPAEAQQAVLDQAFSFFPVDEHPTRLRKAVGFIRVWQRCPREARHLRAALRRQLQRRVQGRVMADD